MNDRSASPDQPPESVFVILSSGPGKSKRDSVLRWLESVLPSLNWRSHLFLITERERDAIDFCLEALSLATAFLDRHGFANLFIHPVFALDAGCDAQVSDWNKIFARIEPFQREARDLLSEARLHLAPILVASPRVDSEEVLRATDFFRSRMAIPSLYVPDGSYIDSMKAPGNEEIRIFLDSKAAGLATLLWQSHVFETVLDRVEREREPLEEGTCRAHMVLDESQGAVFSCLDAWSHGKEGVNIEESRSEVPIVPGKPGSTACTDCIVRATLAMRENLEANDRQTEGRKVCFSLSLQLARQGDFASAANLAHLAYELSKSDADQSASLIQKALCLRESGRLQEADDALALAGEFSEDAGQIAYQRGRVQFVWRDYIEALEWYEIALASKSKQVPVEDMCFEMALCHVNLEEYADARPYLARSQKSGETKAPIAFYRGVCDYGEGRFESALEQFRAAHSLGPAPEDLGRVLFYVGASLKELERYEEAVDVLREAVAADPGDLANHNLLGFCYYKLARHEEAVACFLRAVEIDPKSAIDWANLGSNLRDLGRTKEAVAMYRKALSLDPTIGFARDNLAKLTG